MKKKFVLFFCLLFGFQFCFATTCPSISKLKHGKTLGWNAFDSEDGNLLPPQRLVTFKKDATAFALAEWTTDANHTHGAIHCYYHDKSGSNLEAYLSKDNFLPKNSTKNWYAVSGAMHCAAGTEKCEFKTVLGQTRLAGK